MIYTHEKCSTCKMALKYLRLNDIPFDNKSIVDHPPTLKELQSVLSQLKKKGDGLKNLLNTSGQIYREMNLSQKIKEGMNEGDVLKCLSQNGMLMKRPLIMSQEDAMTGFNEEKWNDFFKKSIGKIKS